MRGRRLGIKGKPGNHQLEDLTLAAQLFGACEKLRAYIAGIGDAPKSPLDSLNAEILMLTAFATAGEIMTVLKDNRRVLRRDLLGFGDEFRLWDDLMGECMPRELVLARAIRDKYVAHTDADMCREFLRRLVIGQRKPFHFAEIWGDESGVMNTTFPWYTGSIYLHLLKRVDSDTDQLDGSQLHGRIVQTYVALRGRLPAFLSMANTLAIKLITRSGLIIERRD